ncbi:hypothetical protein [Nitrospirillum bahiense]|uniref:Uncharacterized protein n=1 Tax=Nitrospirillum amazonense TaxID=28077 RepID=A0A560F1U2_9PROT|nr:hypothetical protein [Nitrospirillum amazonense]TWB15586.1 hypothetical protein FBZ88_12939 [Nitrospirillum amazonense]
MTAPVIHTTTDAAGIRRVVEGTLCRLEWVRLVDADRVELWAGGKLLLILTVSGACEAYAALGRVLSQPHHER